LGCMATIQHTLLISLTRATCRLSFLLDLIAPKYQFGVELQIMRVLLIPVMSGWDLFRTLHLRFYVRHLITPSKWRSVHAWTGSLAGLRTCDTRQIRLTGGKHLILTTVSMAGVWFPIGDLRNFVFSNTVSRTAWDPLRFLAIWIGGRSMTLHGVWKLVRASVCVSTLRP
jgi:hypothetical protein